MIEYFLVERRKNQEKYVIVNSVGFWRGGDSADYFDLGTFY